MTDEKTPGSGEARIIKYKIPLFSRSHYNKKNNDEVSFFKILKKSVRSLIHQVGLLQFIIAMTFFTLFILWLSLIMGPSSWNKNLSRFLRENSVTSFSDELENEDELSPEYMIDNPNPENISGLNDNQQGGFYYFAMLAKISSHLSFYFHPKYGLCAVIISVIMLIILTVMIVYCLFRKYRIRAALLDMAFFRWVELLPQFFILLVAVPVITSKIEPENMIMPFLWSLIICWTLGPYFFRQLQPHVASFFRNRVYDAEMLVGEKRRVVWMRYLIGQHCLSVIIVLVCFVLGNLILTESCMAYLVSFSNQGEFPSLGGGLSHVFELEARHGYNGWEIYKHLSLEGYMYIYFIFAGIIFFHVAGKFFELFHEVRKQMI